ncbi:MAG: IS1595 family transposase, partial [Rhodospirillaceae bacterium]
FCPRCGCVEVYEYRTRKNYKCKRCERQFSLTTDTIFAGRKMAHRDLLMAIAIFSNGAKGYSALQLSRDLDCQYKTAFVLSHKLREAMGAEQNGRKLSGKVEIDGAFFGGYIKPNNIKAERVDRRLSQYRKQKQAVVVMRERKGKTLAFVFDHESDALDTIRNSVAPNSDVYADEAACWDGLHARFNMQRINHSVRFADKDVCTNQAESFFSRLRRAEIGTHHHVSGKYLHQYAREMAWREDHRREANGEQFMKIVGAAMAHPVSENWKGYWQRSAA